MDCRPLARIACPLVALCLWPAAANAGGETGEGELIDEVGHDHGGPAPDALAPAEGPLNGDEPHTIFVNFDGVTLTEAGWDNASQNQTQFPGWGGPYQPFGEAQGGPIREAVLAEVRADYATLNVEITDTRPAEGAYTMIIVSPTNGQPGKLGFASLNCGGANPLGIGFAFFTANGGQSAEKIATTVSHEAAHTLGIEHVGNNEDIMYPSSVNTTSIFVAGCHPIQGMEYCGAAHQVLCPPGQQDVYGELTGLFGEPADPDEQGPEVDIVSPSDQARFGEFEPFDVVVEASDEGGVAQVELLRDGELVATDLTAPYEFARDGLAEGVYEFEAVASDAVGNVSTSATVTVAVGDAELPPEDPGAGDEGGTGISGGDEGLGADSESGGCSCRTDDSPSPFGWLLLGVPLWRVFRRRR